MTQITIKNGKNHNFFHSIQYIFLSIKPPRSGKTGVRVDLLGHLGYPAMEKNKKIYKYSGPVKDGLRRTICSTGLTVRRGLVL